MSLLLYAITDGSLADAVGGEGVAGRPLRTIGADGMVGVVSDHRDPPALCEATLWAFEHVIERMMADRTVLPARFGTLVEDAPTLQGILRDRHDELSSKFERIRGAVELGVRASWPPAEAPAPEPPAGPDAGTSYMLARVARDTRARNLAVRIDQQLGDLARAARYRVLTRPTFPVTAAYLVDRERAAEFVSRVEELQAAIDDTELVCTGPWPPYSFVGAETDD